MNVFLNEETQDFIYFLLETPIVRLVSIVVVALWMVVFFRYSAKREHKPWEKLKVILKKIEPFCLVLQGAVLLFFVVKLFAPITIINISPSDFKSIEADFYEVADGYLLFENKEGLKPITSVFSQEYELPSGAYDVTIRYESERNEINKALTDFVGMFSFSSLENKRAIKFDTLNMGDITTICRSRLWVSDFARVDDFVAEIIYDGYGTLKVEEIVLKESFAYRFVLLAKYFIAFALMDFLYYYFIKKEKNLSGEGTRCLLLLGCVLLMSLPISMTVLHCGDDLKFHLARIISLGEEFANGQFPVRMYTNMLRGYSYANPLFYCDIFLYFPALLYQLFVPLRICYQIYVLSIHLLTAVIGYFSFSTMAKDRNIGFCVAVLYVTAHYRLLCTCIRAAVGEYTAMAFLPLVALGIWLIYREEKAKFKHWCYLTFGMTGLVSTHVISLFLVVIMLALFCLLFWKKTFEKDRFCALVKATITTIFLSLWFIVPFLDSMSMEVKVNGFEVLEFLEPGLSILPMIVQSFFPWGWSLTLGLALFFVLAVCVAVLIHKKREPRGDVVRSEEVNYEDFYVPLKIGLGFSILSILFSLEVFPWHGIEIFFGKEVYSFFLHIQFLWRWLSIGSVLSCVTAVFLLLIVKKEYEKHFQKFVKILLFCGVTTGFLYTAVYAIDDTFAYKYNTSNFMDTVNEMGKGRITGNSEYILNGFGDDYYLYFDTSMTAEGVLLDYEKVNGVGYMSVENPTKESQLVTFQVQNYDNYVVRDEEGTVLPIVEDEDRLIAVVVPEAYEGTLILTYESPFYWRMAELVSLLTFLWVGYLMKKNEMISVADLRKLKKRSVEGGK